MHGHWLRRRVIQSVNASGLTPAGSYRWRDHIQTGWQPAQGVVNKAFPVCGRPKPEKLKSVALRHLFRQLHVDAG